MAYHCIRTVDWEDEACIKKFLYICYSGDVLDSPASEIEKGNSATSEAQFEKRLGIMFVFFKRGHSKTLAEAADATSSVTDRSFDFLNPDPDVPIIENKIFEKIAPWDLRDLSLNATLDHVSCRVSRNFIEITVFRSTLMSDLSKRLGNTDRWPLSLPLLMSRLLRI